MVMYYDGHTLRLSGGATVRHEAEGNSLILELDLPVVGTTSVRLTADEAQKLATTLLRDVSLLKFGVG